MTPPRMVLEDRIRLLAHRLWEAAGRPEGRTLEFWLAAEQQTRREEDTRPDPPPRCGGW